MPYGWAFDNYQARLCHFQLFGYPQAPDIAWPPRATRTRQPILAVSFASQLKSGCTSAPRRPSPRRGDFRMGSSGDVKIFKSIQGVRKKRSIFCLVESTRPSPKPARREYQIRASRRR